MANYKGRSYSRTRARGNTKAKSKNATRALCIILAVLLFAAALVVIGVGSQGFKNWNLPTWFKKEQAKPELPDEPTVEVKDWDNNFIVNYESDDDNIAMAGAKVARTAYAANGIDAKEVICAMELKVKVMPDYADIGMTSLVGRFQDPTAEWAQEKNVSDYIEITKPKYFKGKNTMTAYVKLKQAFGETIEIDVSVTDLKNKTVSTVVTCDYVKRVESATAYFSNYDSQSDIIYTLVLGDYTKRYCVVPQITYGVGSIQPTVSVDSLTLNLSDQLLEQMKEIVEEGQSATFTPSVKAITGSYTQYFFLHATPFGYTNFWGDDVNTDELKEEYRHIFVLAMDKCYSSHFNAKADFTLTYGAYSDTLTIEIPNNCNRYSRLAFDYSNITKSVDSVTVDQGVVF